MAARQFVRVQSSLGDLLGEEYVEHVVSARSALTGQSVAELRRVGRRKVDFLPAAFQRALRAKLDRVGQAVTPAVRRSPAGATTDKFRAATHVAQAPLSGWGYYRVGEDGVLRFLLKSEHYHAPLGHSFPGYQLLEFARLLGIPNATHNNTRGWITRLLEQDLVRAAAGLTPDDGRALAKVLDARRGALNRVLNLETGSLACEAAIKLMLGRFYQMQGDCPAPRYRGKRPVFVVLGDDRGALSANYHGTTVLAQMTRGLWPAMAEKMANAYKVVAIRPNHRADLEEAFKRWDRGPFKIAGLLHELVMMNYGARLLERPYIRRMYALCRAHDVQTLCDEIQSCLWAPGLMMFREYGIHPTYLSIGKGFPGGEYPASRLLLDASADCLPQFGALVTNGQEELASLAYLVTMQWAQANADVTAAIGERYEHRLRELPGRFSQLAGVEGWRHLAGLCFHDLGEAKAFAQRMVERGMDISVQSYKASAPPTALTKLPLIADDAAVDMILERVTDCLKAR